SRYDRRFYAVAAVVLAAAVAGRLLGADDFRTYPSIELGLGPVTLALAALVLLSGLAPLKRRGRVSSLSRIGRQTRHSPGVARV
ncbi:MAG TPA: hypothetical protein VN179_05150, partial [Solirubrobacterales bacterium]|nr:hypothetical protein [Solirubrobacterales bacterium]